MNSEPLMLKNETLASPATARQQGLVSARWANQSHHSAVTEALQGLPYAFVEG
jgi:hypothetical protein